ncbi:MAG TPA: DUF305 domain-containing protein [Gemmatimonadales bacterium]|jgi:uncharacterized protein (DUF305 family)|nr:DUF305 domain-containing protein [Gemmatimonadales bacterium]
MKRQMLVLLAAGSLLVSRAAAQASQAPKDYTAADVHFMSGMIYHHAQAILIAGWAKSHGASPSVQTLCDRIVVSQTDEINLLSRWLATRHEAVPHVDPQHMMMPGMMMDSTHVMPGMLTEQQLAQLDSARGTDFDETFLRFMIQHHQGAITMVNQLFAASGGEEEPVYKMATGVFADQTTEIERMQRMLAADLFGPTTPK